MARDRFGKNFVDDGASFRARRASQLYAMGLLDPDTRRLLRWAFRFVRPFLIVFLVLLVITLLAYIAD